MEADKTDLEAQLRASLNGIRERPRSVDAAAQAPIAGKAGGRRDVEIALGFRGNTGDECGLAHTLKRIECRSAGPGQARRGEAVRIGSVTGTAGHRARTAPGSGLSRFNQYASLSQGPQAAPSAFRRV